MSSTSSCLRPYREVVAAAYGSSSVSIFLNLVALIVGAFLFVKWRRLDVADRKIVWDSYGRFTAVVCCTSIVAALQDIAFMNASAAFFLEVSLPLEPASLSQLVDVAQSKSEVAGWLAAAMVLDSVQTFLSSTSRFLVIVRLMEFALARTGLDLERSFEGIRRVSLLILSLLCVCGIVGSAVAATYFSKAGYCYQEAAAAIRTNSDDSETLAIAASNRGLAYELSAHDAINVGSFSTVAVHLLLLLCYAIAGAFCYKRFKAHPVQQAMQLFGDPSVLPSLRKLQLQIACVVLVAFLTLLLRTIYLLLNVSYNLARTGISACYAKAASFESVFYELPEAQVLTGSLETSVALLVALWGMTSDRTWELMKKKTSSKDSILEGHIPESAYSRVKSQLLG